MNFELMPAPKILPAERNTMYTMPISTQVTSLNTERSSSAPLMTKNSTNRGAVQRSVLAISSSELGQMLQKIVPSIMHTSRDEKPSSNSLPGNLKSSIDSDTAMITKVIATHRRLLREWKKRST